MEDRLLDDSPVPEMLHHDTLEQGRGHSGIPDGIRIHDDDRTARANSETRGLPAFDSIGSEEKPFPVQQVRQHRIEVAAPSRGGTEPARADTDVSRVRSH